MENLELSDKKELLKMYGRLLTFARVADSCRNNKKQIKICKTLVTVEKNNFVKTKVPLAIEGVQEIGWKYEDLLYILARLYKDKNVQAVGKASVELADMIGKLENTYEELEREIMIKDGLSGSDLESAAQMLSEKLEAGKAKLGSVISGGIDKLKKTLSGDES